MTNLPRGALGVIVVAVGACTGSSSKREAAQAGRYDALRPALIAAVNAFPADPAALPRCTPDIGNVAGMALDEAAQTLGVKAPGSGAWFANDPLKTYAGRSMANIERGSRESYDVGRFEHVQRLALFRATAATAPTMTGCEELGTASSGQYRTSTCTLTPGSVDGSAVVFDDKGVPVCAVALKIDGPTSTSVGSRGEVVGKMSSFVAECIHLLFPLGAATGGLRPLIATPSPYQASYQVAIDGVVVFTPTAR